ncbi:MAG: response regulator transcription factor [Actinomycetales bacterium]
MEHPALLLVEDDRELAVLLETLLSEEGYAVEWAADGQRGLHLGLAREFDLFVIDRGLPAVEGVDLLRRLRQSGRTAPALILSARGTVADRVEGLDAGAEDYLVKPFDVEELLARLRALRRRHHDDSAMVSLGDGARLDVGSQAVACADGSTVALSARETRLLEVLARAPRRVFSRDELLDRVFDDAESEAVVETYVHYVRRKLGRGVVRTVRGLGYTLGRL